jgi:hypothetical protein
MPLYDLTPEQRRDLAIFLLERWGTQKGQVDRG